MNPETAAKWQAVGAIAQVVVACLALIPAVVALALAWKANKVNKGAPFAQNVITRLFDVLRTAREVKNHYHRLFEPFPHIAAKETARADWLKSAMIVAGTLEELALVLPDVVPVLEAWRAVEAEEDTHIASEALSVKNNKEPMARYDKTHTAFVSAVAKLMRSLQ